MPIQLPSTGHDNSTRPFTMRSGFKMQDMLFTMSIFHFLTQNTNRFTRIHTSTCTHNQILNWRATLHCPIERALHILLCTNISLRISKPIHRKIFNFLTKKKKKKVLDQWQHIYKNKLKYWFKIYISNNKRVNVLIQIH